MAVSPPQGTKDLLDRQLSTHARDRWPQLRIRYQGALAYVDAVLPDGNVKPLMRLRYFGIPAASTSPPRHLSPPIHHPQLRP